MACREYLQENASTDLSISGSRGVRKAARFWVVGWHAPRI